MANDFACNRIGSGHQFGSMVCPVCANKDELTPEARVCFCGLPMSRNPHPEAGDPGMKGLLVGHMWVCIPCTVGSRHRWANRAMRAESAIAQHRASTLEPQCGNESVRANERLWEALAPVERTGIDD